MNTSKMVYDLSRVDMNESWHLNNNDVLAWIRAAGKLSV
jgi:hypothetical protein